MSQRKKISVLKVMRAITTLLVLVACVMAVMGAHQYNKKEKLVGVKIDIANEKEVAFHNEASIKKLLFDNTHINTEAFTQTIDLHRLENIAKANPWIASANAYIDNQRILHVSVKQRVPEVRVFENDGSSYYLDSSLTPIPVSPIYVAYVPVITQLPRLKNDSTSTSIKAQAYYMAKMVEQDKFWNAQVSEIVWQHKNEFVLIPNIGNHQVRIGDTTNVKEKLARVLQFYKKVMNKIGWEKYTLIDARFKGQVVASPSLPWKPPVDKAMTTMSWVKSIVGADTTASAFSGFVMDTPPTNIAANIDMVPTVPMDAIAKDWNVMQVIEAEANDSLVNESQQEKVQGILPKPAAAVPIASTVPVATKPANNTNKNIAPAPGKPTTVAVKKTSTPTKPAAATNTSKVTNAANKASAKPAVNNATKQTEPKKETVKKETTATAKSTTQTKKEDKAKEQPKTGESKNEQQTETKKSKYILEY